MDWLITTITSEAVVEEDVGQVTGMPCNIPFIQISKFVTDDLANIIS
jgi:hypothetical protein